MGWEMRGGRGRYYTRSRRVNGRVRREYVGSGELAQFIADMDEEERSERRAEGEKRRRERAQREALESLVNGYYRAVDAVLASSMVAAGYHRHDRGSWRKRRGE